VAGGSQRDQVINPAASSGARGGRRWRRGRRGTCRRAGTRHAGG